MNNPGGWTAISLAGALILLGVGLTVFRPQHTISLHGSYRLTADVTVFGRHFITSQSYDYDCARTVPSMDGTTTVAAPCELTGKALRMDLGPRGKLFILMTGWNGDHSGFGGADLMVHQLLVAAQQGGTVPQAVMPTMVRFRDLANPNTVEIVDPGHLDRSFGPAAELKSMTIDSGALPNGISDIDATLPWLAALKGGRLSAQSGTLAYRLHGFDFEWPPIQ